MKLREKLLGCGAAMLLPVEEAPRDEVTQRLIAAGFFCVPHNDGYDRLIMDCRPLNHGEKRQNWMRLKLCGMLCKIVIGPRQTVRGSGWDLSTDFIQLREHESGLSRNTCGRQFSGEGYEAHGGRAGKQYVLVMRCIGMGNINAVDVTEETHLEILNDHGALFRPGLLSWGDEFPQQNILQGVYIDDGLVVGIVDIDGLGKEADDSKLAESCIAALEQENVEIYWKKNFGVLRVGGKERGNFGDESFTAWGTHVQGRCGRVVVEVSKRIDIALVLLHSCAFPEDREVFARAPPLAAHAPVHTPSSLHCCIGTTSG